MRPKSSSNIESNSIGETHDLVTHFHSHNKILLFTISHNKA